MQVPAESRGEAAVGGLGDEISQMLKLFCAVVHVKHFELEDGNRRISARKTTHLH